MTWPGAVKWAPPRLSVFVSESIGLWAAVTVSEALAAVTSVLEADAVSVNEPASRSAWLMLWVPVQTIAAPGDSPAAGIDGVQLKLSSAGLSDTVTLWRVTLPLLVAVSV